jgi:hypothetical protein
MPFEITADRTLTLVNYIIEATGVKQKWAEKYVRSKPSIKVQQIPDLLFYEIRL